MGVHDPPERRAHLTGHAINGRPTSAMLVMRGRLRRHGADRDAGQYQDGVESTMRTGYDYPMFSQPMTAVEFIAAIG